MYDVIALGELLIDFAAKETDADGQFFGITESSSAEQLIQKGLEAIEAVHGKKAVTLQKSKRDNCKNKALTFTVGYRFTL